MKICSTALVLGAFGVCQTAQAAPDLLRYNLSIDATACGNTEDVTGADSYYIAGTFTAVLPDGSARNYSSVTYPFAINDNQWRGYQTVLLDDMLPRGSRIYGQMRFYDEDFAKDWNAVADKFNAAADAGVKAAAASGNPTAAAVAGGAYAAFKVFDAVSSGDKDDLLGQVGVSIGDSALSPGGVAKIVIKDGAMNYDYNHPARAIIKQQADGAFANKSLVNYYSGDTRFSKSDWSGWSSWAYTQSWFSFIQDPNLSPTTGQPVTKLNSAGWLAKMIAAKKAAEQKQFQDAVKRRKAFQVATTNKGPQPFVYQGDFTKKTTGPKPGTTVQGGGGIGGNLGGATVSTLPGQVPTAQVPDIFQLPGAGGDETVANPNPNTEIPVNPTSEEGNAGAKNGEALGAAPVAASKTPVVGKVGQTFAVQVDAKESEDFNFDLPKGQFFVYADVQRLGDKSTLTNIDASVYLLKRNGAEMPGYSGHLIYFNSGDSTTRVGKSFGFLKPTGVRLRFKNESNGAHNIWLTVVPATPLKWLPFGFGDKLLPIKIGPNIGTGATLGAREHQYLRATIPAGKWSVSLGAKSDDNCAVDISSYNARGVADAASFNIYGVGKEERKEKIITLTKPTTLIFRVLNDSQAENVAFDVTIEPATE